MILTFFIVSFIFLMNFLWLYIDDLVGKGLDFGVILELLGSAEQCAKAADYLRGRGVEVTPVAQRIRRLRPSPCRCRWLRFWRLS